ncbi:MAG: alginate lyase family protein [Chitinispirillaceae bacterium]|nr:alginate lyase family protein [Chitinispirillaceae bacterium]
MPLFPSFLKSTALMIAMVGMVHALTIVHPGILHTQADLDRLKAKVNAAAQPWKSGWDRLVASSFAQSSYTPNPQDTVCCGGNGCPNGETFMPLARDCAAAYQNALRYRISGSIAHADKAVAILNAWASTLVVINGDSNAGLRAGLYGYQLAAAAELMRGYSGWAAADFTRFKAMLLTKFYPISSDFLIRHNGTCFDHYWANWDLANMATVLAIGVLCDDTSKVYEAVTYFKSGVGTGQIDRLCNNLYPGTPILGQCQESGRDQGHATLCISLIGAFCQIAYNQGEDLFAYKDNKVLALCEYTAKYNLGYDVPWTDYTNCENFAMTEISSSARGTIRPGWELIYNHYARLKKVNAPWSKMFADSIRPEGGGGQYGTNSGGFDQLGFGTLAFTVDTSATEALQQKGPCVPHCIAVSGIFGGRIRYFLAKEAAVAFTVFDMQGSVLFRSAEKSFAPGFHFHSLPSTCLNPGNRIVELKGNGAIIRNVLPVVR